MKSRHKAVLAWALARVVGLDRAFTSWCADPRRGLVQKELLDDDGTGQSTPIPENRHVVMIWAYVVIANEKALPRDAHRGSTREQAGYLRHLAALGYGLSDVEQLIVDAHPETPAD